MIQDMNKTLTRLFTVALLMMVSMGARAEVKVLFGENGTEKYEGKGGTIQVKQEESRDGGKVTVRLAFIPEKNYTFDEQSLEVYKVFSPESATARALEIDGDALKLEEDKSTNPSEKHYHVEIDSKLALWVKEAQFINMRKSGDETELGTFFIANGNGYSSSNVANNFYLVPATNFNYATGQPHLTTSKTGQVLNSCWKVVQVTVGEKEYYRFIHVVDGKYLTANPAYSGTSGNDVGRLRVHLETMDTPDDNTLFERKANNNGVFNIRHKDMTDKINNNTTTYLDPAGGNIDGTNLTNARTATTSAGKINVGGGIGYWTDEPAARWRFEPVPQNNTYTYNIVDHQGRIAIKYTTGADQPAAKALSDYTDIPEAIRSPYLDGETVQFYTFSDSYSTPEELLNLLTDENKITATPVTNNANIYVTYTTDRLSEKFLKLRGARAFNIVVTNEGYAFDNGGTLAYDNVETNKTQPSHLWNISGGDPYAVQIDNLGTGRYLVSSTMPTLSLAATATNNFILMEQSAAADAGSESVMLMKATGTEDIVVKKAEFQASPVNITTKYNLIDKAGKLIQGNIESESSELGLPDEWRSPLVSEYHYYKTSGYDETTQTYTPANPITSPFDADGGMIYVTYDVSDAIDLDGRNSLGIDGKENKTYMLRYLNGEKFYQENGEDDVMDGSDTRPAELRQAVYPYSNGDAALYVYGPERWNQQLASGASTRSRWLWLIEPANNPATKADLDPYHVLISSNQTQTNYKPGDVVLNYYHSYFRTYQPDGYDKIVTGVTNDNPKTTGGAETDPANNSLATEYMILGTLSQSRLVTLHPVPLDSDHDGTPESNERRTINSFEMYWKNNPTIQGNPDHTPMPIPGVLSEGNKVTTEGRGISLNSQQKAEIENHKGYGWHVYQEWANSAAWVNNGDGTTGKKYLNEEHVFQTINMGATGEFVFEAVTLVPQVILLDQHGWEIMRVPLSNTAKLKEYNSPMVDEYQWYSTSYKIPGYHKYTVSGTPAHVSTSITDVPSGDTDFYVTYTVKSEYADAYTGAATSDATIPSAYLLKQGDSYASTNGSAITATTAPASMEDIPNVMQWNLRPNFDIDREMGYKYAGEAGAQDGAKSKEATDQDNYDEGRNGFDPYNVQIQSVAYPLRYFTANTTGIALEGGAWKGTSTEVNLQNLSNKQTADGYDQTKLSITNATFMVVDDGARNMRLMPRFDNSKVVTFSISSSTPFKTLEPQTDAAAAGDEGTGTQTLWLELVPKATEVHFSSEMTDMNGHYLLAEDFTFDEGFTSLGTSDQPFRGIIDGQLNTISGTTSVPLVAYAEGAIIRNVILEEVGIDGTGNVGSIVNKAGGFTRIYNCGILGGTVKGTAYTGGLVGLLDGTSRVINCYSFADITGGTHVGGIVGYNNETTTASSINTMVMNCMFYGDITGGNTVSPVFGGNNIANLQGGLNTFNYYAYDKLKTKAISNNKYNSALAVEEKYLNRFEFYRLLLNSNKKLAAFYATGDVANADQMAKWVLETADRTIANPKPYPILKSQGYYPSIINIDAENAPSLILENDKPREEDRKKGGKLGKTLSVTIATSKSDDGGGQTWPSGASVTTTSLTLQRTDKDFDRFNYNYDKVQLPYYNDVGTGNYTGNRVVTGWKITAITAVADDPYTSANYPTTGITDYPNHNYADRRSSNKDLYSVSGRVFSQGAYFDVPYGVTSITIEPYWGKACYIADENYDVVYKNDYSGKQFVTQTGTQVTVGTTTFNGQGVQKSIEPSLTYIANNLGGLGPTVYDNALVLVGNLHLDVVPLNGDRPFTMMSVDEDNDHEPDYSLIYHHIGRTNITPIRFDFLNIPGTAQAQKPNGASLVCNFTIVKTRGWFEITNTALVHSDQFEYENKELGGPTKIDAPLILLGGVFDQFVSTQKETVDGKTIYIHVGSNVWIKEFGLGTHSDGSKSTPHVPVSVTGGEFPGFYLTGTYNADASVRSDNAECYISGGYFHEAAGASLEQIDGNVQWQIYDADIDEFFGGGINEAKPITGKITTNIYNSHVSLFCGGPKFGDMEADKTVTTHADGCVFGTYFGAGFGGTAVFRKKYYDKEDPNFTNLQKYYYNPNSTTNHENEKGKYYDGTSTSAPDAKYGKKGPGVATDFDYEFFVWSSGKTGARFYIKFAAFSLAQCNNVTSNLKKCTIENSYYGGGSLGKVVGTVTSELEDCEVKGNVFGAGYSASLPTLQVRNEGFTKNPNFNKVSGMFEPGTFSGTTEFAWRNISDAQEDETSLTVVNGKIKNGTSGSNLTKHFVYTDIDLSTSNLGSVQGNVNLTIKGNSVIGTAGNANTGNVFGGGESSYVVTNSNITDQKVTVNLEGETEVLGNVFGGGDKGEVQCSTEVNIRQTAPTTTDPEP